MKRSLVLITIFAIISVAYTDTDNCQSGFYNNLKSYQPENKIQDINNLLLKRVKNDEIKAFPGGKKIFNILVKLKLCKE